MRSSLSRSSTFSTRLGLFDSICGIYKRRVGVKEEQSIDGLLEANRSEATLIAVPGKGLNKDYQHSEGPDKEGNGPDNQPIR